MKLPFYAVSFVFSLFLSGGTAHAIITDLNDSTDNWTAIEYFKQSDYYNDEQAQKGGGDIVGDVDNNQSGFYKRYDYGADGVADGGDDAMGFRIRLADDSSSYMYIGFDVAGDSGLGPDGVIDFYLGVNFGQTSAKKNKLAFYDSGTDLNISPSTSSFSEYSVYKTGDSADVANYANLSPVVLGGNEGYSGTGASDDLNGGGTDYFLSFQIEMSVLNTAYQGISGTSNVLTSDSEMMLVVGSSTNGQNFNQDFGGIDGTTGADLPWTDPSGVGAKIYTAEG